MDDDTLLQRVIPYVLSRPLLSDSSALVRATALRTLSRAVSKGEFFLSKKKKKKPEREEERRRRFLIHFVKLELIRSFPATESSIFPDYLIPTLLPISGDQEELVREVPNDSS